MEIKEIKRILQEKLTGKRYEHTIGVMYTASSMAMRYDVDIEKAMLSGLLHDCAKYLSNDKKIEKCQKYKIPMTESELSNPELLHAKLGAYYAKNKYKINDEDILNAILFHTTGRPNMSDLEKIIYIADYIEPNRNQATNLKEVRHLAFVDLDECMLKILKDTLVYLENKKSNIDDMTVKTYNFYKNQEEILWKNQDKWQKSLMML